MIILDDLERLIDYIDMGPRFSNVVVQALQTLIKKKPENDRKLVIIGTTASKYALEQLGLVDCFNVTSRVPSVKQPEELKEVLSNFNCSEENQTKICQDFQDFYLPNYPSGIGIQNLLLAIQIAGSKTGEDK